MPKPFLREPFATLAGELIETLIAGHKEWRPDLAYPESHSDMQAAVRAVIRKYDVKLRPVPLDSSEIVEPPSVCPVCKLPTGSSVKTLGHIGAGRREVYAHPECVVFPNEREKGSAT
jgi:hypothetical protein